MALLLSLGVATPAAAQQRSAPPVQPAPAPAQLPVPDQASLAKLLWSTMAAVDHANRTGNYSVLRDLGSTGFRSQYSPETLASAFAQIRQRRIDLADTLLVAPVHAFDPGIVQGMLRMRGSFNLRPTAIQFDLLYVWENGWRLQAIALQPVSMNAPVGR